MTAFTRLWQRAPIWRVALCTAVVTAFVGSLFLRGQSVIGGVTSTYRLPHLDDLLIKPKSGIFETFGRQIPLPPGSWYVLISATTAGHPALDSVMLMHTKDGKPDAFISIQGLVVSPGEAPLHINYRCASAGELTYEEPPPSGDTQFECWSLRPRSLPAGWQEPQEGLIFHLSLQQLAEVGATPFGPFVELNWFLSDSSGALLVSYLMPDATAVNGQLVRQSNAMKLAASQWAHLLEKGADGTLSLNDVHYVTKKWPGVANLVP